MKEGNVNVANEPRDLIRMYILRSINVPNVDNDVNLFESGLVNSLFAIQLMTFVEKSFGIKVTMDDLDLNNFSSVNAISTFVKHKQAKKSDLA